MERFWKIKLESIERKLTVCSHRSFTFIQCIVPRHFIHHLPTSDVSQRPDVVIFWPRISRLKPIHRGEHLEFKIRHKVIKCIVINQAIRLNNVTQLNEMIILRREINW